MENQCFRCSSPSLLLSFFPKIRDCFLRNKRELATQFSFFVCPPLFPVRIRVRIRARVRVIGLGLVLGVSYTLKSSIATALLTAPETVII